MPAPGWVMARSCAPSICVPLTQMPQWPVDLDLGLRVCRPCVDGKREVMPDQRLGIGVRAGSYQILSVPVM